MRSKDTPPPIFTLKDVRDEIGNFYDSDTGTTEIEHHEWKIHLW